MKHANQIGSCRDKIDDFLDRTIRLFGGLARVSKAVWSKEHLSRIRNAVLILQAFPNRVEDVVKLGLLLEREIRPRQDGQKFIAYPIINSFTAN